VLPVLVAEFRQMNDVPDGEETVAAERAVAAVLSRIITPTLLDDVALVTLTTRTIS
jgi:hypothetical protein